MIEGKYRIKKEYSDTHQMYFYYPEKKNTSFGFSYWSPLGGPSCLFSRESDAIKWIKNYDSGETNPTQYIEL
jgi:hypothetical protein